MKKMKLLLSGIFLIVLFLSSCQSKVDLNKEKEEITNYIEKAVQANIEKDLEKWGSLYADSCVYPIGGKIVHLSKEDIKKDSEKVFSNQKFKYTEFNELEETIIHISKDATMAWYMVNMRVFYSNIDSLGNEKIDSTEIASLFILEKQNSKWLEVTGVNTYTPQK
ncbi:MAG: hypothetical protein A2X13_14900 [Bacteroidetes bacterium GWC2_33_15]|nr:MAG: hypothetical protein A2X10_06965 [Bacteroidetes bacterium GWA2_33_15]OFX50158.1 MAG: hypothetical protein A2X13_14900 [Bacteroidetes bacterium GWC2_33_15]OFX65310.1 MAG: hypothetical protein A2X15_04475 [Bacteroidetes bacterium GWB2_32_14]OFX70537.1 MAG: hypothetical protein A2X14_04530 [Bacteroidetes bacterium GWD2_33_33]HAN19589.1 hypothetical protein [Bacteroidales bacterium]